MATFTVLNLNDSGTGSLRDFINQANAMADADTINFDPGLSGTISLTSGELLITDSLSILGPGADLLTIDAQQNSRVFHIDDDDSSNLLDVALDGLTITGGRTTENGRGRGRSGDGEGGGIRSFENLSVSNSIISGNSTVGDNAFGGGIYGSNGDLSVSNSTVSGNSTSGDFAFGGGISASSLSVINSTVSGNSASGSGGGISASSLSVINSTVSGNSASRSGGGIYGSNLSVINSTVSGNSASDFGGGIGGRYSNLRVINSTVSGNSAAVGGGIADSGLPSSIFGITGSLSVESSIIANNTTSAADPDVSLRSDDNVTSGSNSLIGTTEGNPFTDGVNGNQVGTAANPLDPQLGPLQDNGGPTFTQSPLPGSPAIDMGAKPQGLLTDQRGPGFVRSFGLTDAGALEVQPVVEPPTEPPTSVPEPTSVVTLALMGAVMGRKVLQKRRHS